MASTPNSVEVGQQDSTNQPSGHKRSGSGVQFDNTLNVGVAASTQPLRFSRLFKGSGAGDKAAQASGADDAAPSQVREMPAPGGRFNSSAVPSRPALKASGSHASLADAAAVAPATATPWGQQDQQQQEQEQEHPPPGPTPKSAAGALFLSALGGGPGAAAAPPPPAELLPGAPGDDDGDDDGVPLTRRVAGRAASDAEAPGATAPPAGAAAAGGGGSGGSNAFMGGSSLVGSQRVSPDLPPAALAAPLGKSPELQSADTVLTVDQGQRPTGAAGGGGDDGASVAPSSLIVPPGATRPLPPLARQLSARALGAGVAVGLGFALLAQRLVLAAGLVPSFQVAAALACWALLRGYSFVLGRDMACIAPLAPQEVAVASAAALATAGAVVTGGFGPFVGALSQAARDAAGPTQPAGRSGDVLDFSYAQGVVWLLLVGVAGGLMVVPFRRSLMSQAGMVFPTGAATGHMINALHTPAMSYHGRKQMARFAQWSAVSLFVSGYQWIFNNPACDGFAKFPTFGLALAKWRWLFDFQTPLVGVGLMAPLGVAWSMVVGAGVSWGVLWPVLDGKAGDWFPAGLPAWNAQGLFGYQLVLAMGLLLADGLVTVVRGCITGGIALGGGRNGRRRFGGAGGGAAPGAAAAHRGARRGGSSAGGNAKVGAGKRKWQADALAAMETDALSDVSSLQFSLAALERGLRRHVFMSHPMPGWSLACVVAAAMLLIAAAFAAPALLQPLGGVRWWHLLVAAAAAPFAALANTRAAGATDISAAPAFFAAALVAFAAWGGAGGGVGVGLVAAGLLLGVAQSAAEMGFSFAAGYTTLASPTAVFVAHVVGCLAGALFAPFAYALLSPALPPSPLAAPARVVAALFAQGGARALPAYAGWMGLAALVVGLVLASVRQVISSRARVMVPMPVVMGVIFLAGANVAVGVAFGAALRIAWRWRHPRSADAYAALVGGALIAGDGVWGVGRALLASFGVAAPICMSFAPAPSAVP